MHFRESRFLLGDLVGYKKAERGTSNGGRKESLCKEREAPSALEKKNIIIISFGNGGSGRPLR